MKCKACDYRLWNLPARRCPECGTPFRPSEYEFIPGKVRFSCPHCGQCYYGTDEKGHLVPPEFDCTSCGQHIQMDEMVLLPAEGVAEEDTQLAPVPWLERKKQGRVRAWLSTVRLALFAPSQLIRRVPENLPTVQALRFAVLTQCVYMAPIICLVVLMAVIGAMGPVGGAAFGPVPVFAILPLFVLLGLLVGVRILISLWALLAHGILLVTGPLVFPLRRTFHAMCFSSAANALAIIPCCGGYVSWAWWVVSATLMLRAGHQVHAIRAAAAVLLPPLAVAGAWVGVVELLPSGTGIARPATAPAPVLADSSSTVLDALVRNARANGGRGPDHAVRLVTEAALTANDFILPGSLTRPQKIPVGPRTLKEFPLLSPRQEKAAIEAAAKTIPSGAAVHRLGDFVFTYDGIDVTNCDPGLWLLIGWPDPDANDGLPEDFVAGRADGTVQRWPLADLSAEMKRQNRLRQKHGLLPVPHPITVKHARPASSAK